MPRPAKRPPWLQRAVQGPGSSSADRIRPARRTGIWAAALAVFWVSPAGALTEEQALGRAEIAVKDAEVGVAKIVTVRTTRQPPSAEERLAAGEMFLRNKDYARSISSFNQVIELFRQRKATPSSHADALYLLGEAYFRDEQLLSARRHYRALVELAAQQSYTQYAGRALGRLVDVALRTNRLNDLDFVFTQMARLKGDDSSGSLAYARGKAYFARRDYGESQRALQAVSKDSAFAHQAAYLLGVIFTNLALGDKPESASAEDQKQVPESSKKFARAILQFQRVTQMKGGSPEHRHVIDLSWMALGRLFYETDNYLDAADAYGHIDRQSQEYSTMLFELAWVYVRGKQFQQARRALEFLAIVSPESLTFADGSLLRADLMLRSQDFDDALRVYQSVRSRFDPIRDDVDRFLSSTRDPAVYYDRLVDDRLGVRTSSDLPEVVMQWVRDESEDERVFALIDDVNRSRELVRKSRRMVKKMDAVLGSSTRAKAFPDIKLRLQHALGLTNQLTLAKRDLALGLEEADDSAFSGELGRVRAERRGLMKRLNWLPVSVGDFQRRESSGQNQWNKLSQQLQALTLEADKLQAIVNGLTRVLRDAERFGVTNDKASRERFEQEIEANERDLDVYRKRIASYREAIERGRVQIGFGDKRYVEDQKVRVRFERLFKKELTLASQGRGGDDAQDFARDAMVLFNRATVAANKLRRISKGYQLEVRERSQDLSRLLRDEEQKIQNYADRLDALDQHARLLVGEVAMRNFALVRERLKSIVLRADVGIVQQAWEVREGHRERVRKLQRERASEEQALNDELNEVLHDGSGEQ